MAVTEREQLFIYPYHYTHADEYWNISRMVIPESSPLRTVFCKTQTQESLLTNGA